MNCGNEMKWNEEMNLALIYAIEEIEIELENICEASGKRHLKFSKMTKFNSENVKAMTTRLRG